MSQLTWSPISSTYSHIICQSNCNSFAFILKLLCHLKAQGWECTRFPLLWFVLLRRLSTEWSQCLQHLTQPSDVSGLRIIHSVTSSSGFPIKESPFSSISSRFKSLFVGRQGIEKDGGRGGDGEGAGGGRSLYLPVHGELFIIQTTGWRKGVGGEVG